MKKTNLLLSLILGIAVVGCHAQLPPNPTTYSCPPSSGTAYSALNSSTPATGLTYNDTHPAAGTYCYIVQSVIDQTGQPRGISLPSNIAGPFTLSGTNTTALTWNAPTTGPTPTGYVMSRAAAISSTLIAPALVNGTVASDVKPALPSIEGAKPTYLSLAEPLKLKANVR